MSCNAGLTIKLDGEFVSRFDVCQAHQQLEADYNVGGILRERPSNRRRLASTGWQLSRMQYRDLYRWVDITKPSEDPTDEHVRWIYMANVMKWGLPADEELRAAINTFFARDFLLLEFPAYVDA